MKYFMVHTASTITSKLKTAAKAKQKHESYVTGASAHLLLVLAAAFNLAFGTGDVQ